MNDVTLLIGADVVPTPASAAMFSEDATRLLDDALREKWFSADLRAINLECPLTDAETPIEKCGMHLSAPTGCANGLRQLRLDAAGLANNHIFDHGTAGLRATMDALQRIDVPAFGAGENAAQADAPCVLEKNGMRIALYAVCEHEFSCAGEDSPGANGLNELLLGDRLREIRSACDRLVVLYHGGREYYPYPSPRLQARCRHMVACGADAVLCQHSHCIGSQETYRGKPIVYGQGNFLFDMDDEPCFETGLVVQLLFTGEETAASYLPVRRAAHGAKLLTGADAEEVLNGFFARSEEIAAPGFVAKRYREYAAEYRERMLKVFLSGNPFLRVLCRLYRRRPTRVYSLATRLAIKNTIACESLNELVEACLTEPTHKSN